jgi:hypothetical protein
LLLKNVRFGVVFDRVDGNYGVETVLLGVVTVYDTVGGAHARDATAAGRIGSRRRGCDTAGHSTATAVAYVRAICGTGHVGCAARAVHARTNARARATKGRGLSRLVRNNHGRSRGGNGSLLIIIVIVQVVLVFIIIIRHDFLLNVARSRSSLTVQTVLLVVIVVLVATILILVIIIII